MAGEVIFVVLVGIIAAMSLGLLLMQGRVEQLSDELDEERIMYSALIGACSRLLRTLNKEDGTSNS